MTSANPFIVFGMRETYKRLEAASVTGEVLKWFKIYLSDRRQRVVLPGVSSFWDNIRAGVPQGSILVPLLFLLFINDIVYIIYSKIPLFADDTILFIKNALYAATCLNFYLDKITRWAVIWLVTFTPSKTEVLLLYKYYTTPTS